MKKTAEPNDMGCHDAAGMYSIPPNTNMNGPKHMALLKEKLKLHGCMICMQYSAPSHQSQSS